MTDNRTTELLKNLSDLACDIHAAEIISHVYITHRGWVINSEWLDSWHEEFDRVMQEIADELNVERHVETCRITASSTDGLCSDNPRHYFELSCGHSFTLDGLEPPNYCEVCGAKVIQGVDNAD